jgi:hypothetical protein
VTVNYPDVGHSRHTLSFISSEARHTSLGYGLIDTWYQRALSQGIAWLDFGLVWKPGDPSEWRGYSRFKRQFHLHLHRAPRSLIRLSWR